MNKFKKALRYTLFLLFLIAIWAIIYYAFDPTFERSLLDSMIIFIPVLIIVIGLLPKMYLHSLIEKVIRKSDQASQVWIAILAIGVPIIFLIFYSVVFRESYTLFNDSLSEYVRNRQKWDLIFFAAGGVLNLIFLIINIFALILRTGEKNI